MCVCVYVYVCVCVWLCVSVCVCVCVCVCVRHVLSSSAMPVFCVRINILQARSPVFDCHY